MIFPVLAPLDRDVGITPFKLSFVYALSQQKLVIVKGLMELICVVDYFNRLVDGSSHYHSYSTILGFFFLYYAEQESPGTGEVGIER
jgi:hypothetical protein